MAKSSNPSFDKAVLWVLNEIVRQQKTSNTVKGLLRYDIVIPDKGSSIPSPNLQFYILKQMESWAAFVIFPIEGTNALPGQLPVTSFILKPIEKTLDMIHRLYKQGISYDSYMRNVRFYKFPHELPSGTTWGNIYLALYDKSDNVKIQVSSYNLKTNYKNMGFEDQKSKRPNRAWKFLKRIARSSNAQIMYLDGIPTAKDQKDKQLLSATLKYYFSIECDPFEQFDKKYSYKPIFTLILRKREPKLSKEEIENQMFEDIYQEETKTGRFKE